MFHSSQVIKCLTEGRVTTTNGFVPLGDNLSEVTICVHSDTVRLLLFFLILVANNKCPCLQPGAEDIAKIVKSLVDEINTTGKAPTA